MIPACKWVEAQSRFNFHHLMGITFYSLEERFLGSTVVNNCFSYYLNNAFWCKYNLGS